MLKVKTCTIPKGTRSATVEDTSTTIARKMSNEETKNVLVIHPAADRGTDFLEDIYVGIDAVVIRGNVSDSLLRKEIARADKVYLLGHGFGEKGLYGHGRLIITNEHAEALRGKMLIGIWCYAQEYFNCHRLDGLFSDMMISELPEAEYLGVSATENEINLSNRAYAESIARALVLFPDNFAAAAFNAKEIYIASAEDPNHLSEVMKYNSERVFGRSRERSEL